MSSHVRPPSVKIVFNAFAINHCLFDVALCGRFSYVFFPVVEKWQASRIAVQVVTSTTSVSGGVLFIIYVTFLLGFFYTTLRE
jgi:hypothetical protein